MAFNNWPYTNFQDLNLGWILGKLGVVEKLAIDAAADVAQYDARITANTNAIQQLGIELGTISDVARVFVNNDLEAYYRGKHITGSELVSVLQSHGTLPYVEYNGEIYMLDTVSNAGDLRFSMGHTVDALNELVIRHIMIPAQSYNAAYSITNVSAGSGGSSSVFTVTITDRGAYATPQYICDHTYAEIYSQMQNDKTPILLVSMGSNPTTYEICGMGVTGTRTINGESVACIRFADPYWLVNSSNDVGVWTIDANGNVDHMAALKQLAVLDNIVDLVNDGVSTNALLKTAQTLTAAQQEQVRTNIGAGTTPYQIPVTVSDGVYSTTATGLEIFENRANCYAEAGGLAYYPIGCSLSGPVGTVYLASFDPHTSGAYDGEILQFNLTGASNVATVSHYSNDIATRESVITDSDSSIQMDINPNTLYIFPNAGQLTVTPVNAVSGYANEYHFLFYSGSTATTLTLPSTIRQPDGFTVEANHWYEVSILENNMLASGWAVTP